MKTQQRSRSLLTSGLMLAAALALAACSDRDRSNVRTDTANTVDRAQSSMSAAWNDVKGYTYEKKDDFVANTRAMTSKMDAEISELQAKYAGAKADASRSAAMDELKSARSNFNDKMSALGRATADTWNQAKQESIAAWDRVEAAYRKARAD